MQKLPKAGQIVLPSRRKDMASGFPDKSILQDMHWRVGASDGRTGFERLANFAKYAEGNTTVDGNIFPLGAAFGRQESYPRLS